MTPQDHSDPELVQTVGRFAAEAYANAADASTNYITSDAFDLTGNRLTEDTQHGASTADIAVFESPATPGTFAPDEAVNRQLHLRLEMGIESGPGRAGGERVARAEKGATATGQVLGEAMSDNAHWGNQAAKDVDGESF